MSWSTPDFVRILAGNNLFSICAIFLTPPTGLAKIISVHCEEVRGAQGDSQELARQV